MTDKEVGELWLDATPQEQDLIRKLVEERNTRLRDRGWEPIPAEQKILRDFGIDPETWEKANEEKRNVR